jgi:uncharacterized protein with NAD-binding domain and iron-sulfur cluster
MSQRAIRVAVLGGGCAGVAAACELSRTPELRQRFQVTLYEASFRLGGKGATGRNAARGQRIEEHGLHLWMGFHTRSFRLQARLALALARGLTHDVFRHGAEDYHAIDHLDFCAWLERWGARSSEVHDAPPIRALYNLAFAYPDGISGHGRGQMAAGAAAHALLQLLFRYRGAPFWRMRAGMGDTVFAPLYRLLVQRGVRIEFFHELRQLRASRRPAELHAIEFDLRARPRGTYVPLALVHGMPCWPEQPRWPELQLGERLRPSWQNCAQPSERRRLLAGETFDAAILAIPAPCHRTFAAELLESSASYRSMIEHTHSVATVAAQIWLKQSLPELGWMDRSTIYTSGPRPLGNWAEMNEVLEHEQWPREQTPKSVLYFCDACPDELAALLQDEAGRVELLERAFRQWSQLLGSGSMAAPLARAALLGALGDQYLRVNHRPSERYILSLPGGTRHRLAPHESDINRLYFAGDWTRTSINGGSVEAAVESGQTAAQRLLERWG